MRFTLAHQSAGFMIGSALFAVATIPGGVVDASVANALCFIGAFFFTGAGLIQLARSDSARTRGADWWTAVVQSFGTIMFNVSTAFALLVTAPRAEDRLVWSPDAVGSIAFLVSGCLAFAAFAETGRPRAMRDREWGGTVINFLGCAAFGVSAIGAFVRVGGDDVSAALATGGTFIGALCFFAAAAVVMPAPAQARSRA